VDFNNIKPSDIIRGTFASDGPKEKSGDARMQAAQMKMLKEQIEQQTGGEMIGINVNDVSEPMEAIQIIPAGMIMAAKGFDVLRKAGKISSKQLAAFKRTLKATQKIWKEAIENIHEAHEAAGNCTCKKDAENEDD